jgi:hypothetical protein
VRLPYLRSVQPAIVTHAAGASNSCRSVLRFGDQRTAVSDIDKASGHVVDEKRDTQHGGRRSRSASRALDFVFQSEIDLRSPELFAGAGPSQARRGYAGSSRCAQLGKAPVICALAGNS